MDEQRVLFEKETVDKDQRPVECLGMTFENDEKRREYFLEKLREKLNDPEFRKIEGFPIGEDEDILALSDPPYYTACPNPFLGDFIKHYGKPFDPGNDNYKREPFAADVSEGKNDPIYNAHSYHTKVPHKAIMRYILHYTEPGDIVFDGFCGTGMTGVAAQLCGDKDTVESLGYKVNPDDTILDENGKPFSKLGVRHAVLNDLSPAATFIAYNYNTKVDVYIFEKEALSILKEVEDECGWMYETMHIDGKTKGRINYTVWSDVFICPECTGEIVFWDVAVDTKAGKVLDEFPCPHCNAVLTKKKMDRSFVTRFDNVIHQTVKQAKQVPVLINYNIGNKRFKKKPDNFDLNLIYNIEKIDNHYWFPTYRMMKGGETRRNDPIGITHIHHFYTLRNLKVISTYVNKLSNLKDIKLIGRLMFAKTASERISSRLASIAFSYFFHGGGGFVNAGRKGTFYVSSVVPEVPPYISLKTRIQSLLKLYIIASLNFTSTQAFNKIFCPNDSVDYIFVDPPFGANINYSELNFIWESWLRVFTNIVSEAIENKAHNKGIDEYRHLMTGCFKEAFRVLKPGRWMTVEFSNTKAIVWNTIQTALLKAGFIVANISALDKKQGSVNAYTTSTAVIQDLIISAYKPNGGLEERFKIEAGTEEGAWDFVRTHLKQLPVFVSKDGQAEMIAERQNYLLFDRMVAFHVQRGVAVPLSAAEFYLGLEQRFSYREGMYFLEHQAAEFDKKRMTVKEILQLDLFVTDEASAIQWLKQLLTKKPQTFQEIHPQFLKEIGGWHKYEKSLELSLLLEQNFLRCDGKEGVPNQVHSYLSTNYKELRNLPKDDPALRAKAKDRWYVPDPNNAADLEKLRERALLKEFAEYLPPGYVPPKYDDSQQFLPGMKPETVIPQGKKLKIFRLEAVRAGFKKAWQERDYVTIIAVARRISETVLQEDPKLLMWYDQARTRLGID
jgi:DNA modification methylase